MPARTAAGTWYPQDMKEYTWVSVHGFQDLSNGAVVVLDCDVVVGLWLSDTHYSFNAASHARRHTVCGCHVYCLKFTVKYQVKNTVKVACMCYFKCKNMTPAFLCLWSVLYVHACIASIPIVAVAVQIGCTASGHQWFQDRRQIQTCDYRTLSLSVFAHPLIQSPSMYCSPGRQGCQYVCAAVDLKDIIAIPC